MSKESVMAALRKAREAREGNIFGGTGQAEFNKILRWPRHQNRWGQQNRQ